ncbi:DUF3149 domain-containing protein [Alteromonas pelagimontana]|uniref:DUF3149 domain-containing protein n=1 Tax=Alteromonas pelagimontana TaxID=1858656 RepID=A0A6M4MAV3_9ALTE|nr:DUF3149 domain-containing protein [Alteromonas pelagimontana]
MMLKMLTDPVVWGPLLGILMIIVMMLYYTYLFMHNMAKEEKSSKSTHDNEDQRFLS